MKRIANLIFIKDNEIIKKLAIENDKPAKIVIGRDLSCDVQITSSFIGRQHAEISFNGNSFRIKDLNSANGIFINGKKIQEIIDQATEKDSKSVFRAAKNLRPFCLIWFRLQT